jgi:hypothetical protein
MGTYTDFSVAGYPLINSKSTVVPEVMTVFRESDKRVFTRRLGDRNPHIWGDAYADEADEVETATMYVCRTDAVIARLDVMGFTINRARHDFESGRQAKLATYQEWAKDEPGPPWFADEAQLIESLSFDTYLGALSQVLSECLRPKPFDDNEKPGLSSAIRYILDDNDDYLFGFFASDIRCLIRAVCEVVPKLSEVIQDITDLVDGGYYAPEEPVCQQSVDSLTLGHLENSNRIVLTEGSTDTQVLKASLRLLYPHLSAYYSFLDFDATRVPGGAGQLVSLVKGLAAAGIGNRIIAIFDNDSAARDAKRSLTQLRLPSNIAVLSYPDLEILRSYPTLGPSGNTNLDVNGLAASIELYFGSDVLRGPDGSLAPVQWKGYVEPMASYQGEVLGKAKLQTAFSRKLAIAEKDPADQVRQDWSGIDAILRVIFGAFEDEVKPAAPLDAL